MPFYSIDKNYVTIWIVRGYVATQNLLHICIKSINRGKYFQNSLALSPKAEHCIP